MELYIFDKQLNFIGIIDDYSSFRWVRRYNKKGEFELQYSVITEKIQLLQKGNIIYKKGDDEAGCIDYRKLKKDSNGKEVLVVKGKFLTGYLNRRIIFGSENINDTVENTMRTIVNKNCISPTDNNRIINNLILGNLMGFTETISYQVSYKNLGDELENLSNTSDLGFKVSFDINNKQLIFNVYKGLDRSINQNANPRAIFSKEFDNVLEQEFTDSSDNYKNVAIVQGLSDGYTTKMETVGDSSGIDRFEVFVDQSSLSTDIDGGTMTDVEYSNLLISKGNESLAETKEVQTFESKININSNLRYKIDFDLGDIVTCINNKWGLILNSRIIEVEEIYESQQQINITFGNNIPTLIDKVKYISKQKSGGGTSSSSTGSNPTVIDGGSFV
jgi:hypothetical protein